MDSIILINILMSFLNIKAVTENDMKSLINIEGIRLLLNTVLIFFKYFEKSGENNQILTLERIENQLANLKNLVQNINDNLYEEDDENESLSCEESSQDGDEEDSQENRFSDT